MHDLHDREEIYDLLFAALLELRIEGAERKSARTFRLADLFHQLPTWLKELDAGDIDAEEVILRLRQRAERSGISAWLEAQLDADAKTSSATTAV